MFDRQVDGGTEYAWRPIAVTGTVGSGLPALPPSSIVLAEVPVTSTTTAITTIIDRRELSGLGDVPIWDYSGTQSTPQSIPHNTNTLYIPEIFFERVGVGTTTDPGSVVCRTPGRYAVSFSARFASTGTDTLSERNVAITLRDAGGALLRGMSTSIYTGRFAPITVAGTFRMRRGEVISPQLFQASGGALAVTNLFREMDFTGAWVGP